MNDNPLSTEVQPFADAVTDVMLEFARYVEEVLHPIQRRLRAADPHEQVYTGDMPLQLAEAWARWACTREHVMAGRHVPLGEMLDSGRLLSAEAPRSVAPLDPAYVAHYAQVRRMDEERAARILTRKRREAVSMQVADCEAKLRLLEPRDYYLTDPWSAQVREMLDWFRGASGERAARARRDNGTKGGRPALGRATTTQSVRLYADQLERLEGVNLSELMRNLLDDHLDGE